MAVDPPCELGLVSGSVQRREADRREADPRGSLAQRQFARRARDLAA
jgi:hypothetical protein